MLDPSGLVEAITEARASRPVGLVMVGWDQPTPGDPDYSHQVERSVLYSVAGCAGQADMVVAASAQQIAVLRAPLTAPASTEGLAHRIAQRLDVELDRLATVSDRPVARWAIGAAVERSEDADRDLLRFAEAALNDAWLLGGRRVVAFDDGDRELSAPPNTP